MSQLFHLYYAKLPTRTTKPSFIQCLVFFGRSEPSLGELPLKIQPYCYDGHLLPCIFHSISRSSQLLTPLDSDFIFSPMIGGSLSNPTDRFPKFFSYVFFKKYPYFLPCCVAACFSALGFILCYFFLKEVLLVLAHMPLTDADFIICCLPRQTSRKSQRDCIGTRSPVIQDYGATNNEEVASPDPVSGERYCVKQLLAMPIIRTICMSAYMLSFISTAFEVIFVLFCYSPIEQGGLGFSVCLFLVCR